MCIKWHIYVNMIHPRKTQEPLVPPPLNSRPDTKVRQAARQIIAGGMAGKLR